MFDDPGSPEAVVPPVLVERWPSELPLLVCVALTSLVLWSFIFVSLVGLFYAVLLGVFFFFGHLAFVAHLRGSAVRLGPDQLPDLHRRVEKISLRLGLRRPPEAYLMQAGGVLNALATKLFATNFIVLYSNLLEACGDDEKAADFVIAHEIGHLKAGHLRLRPILLPGRMFPFLGNAWSRACEYTADRYGFAGIADSAAATHGLAVLAAGGAYSRNVNVDAFVGQRRALDTVFMTLGAWMSSHPPLARRVAELDRIRFPRGHAATGPIIGAVGILVLILLIPFVGGAIFVRSIFQNARKLGAGRLASPPAATPGTEPSQLDPAKARQLVSDIRMLNSVAEDYRRRTGALPRNVDELYKEYERENPGLTAPLDPYTGRPYAYEVHGSNFRVWSPS
jgi:Zn-dependent protease with chaperone function